MEDGSDGILKARCPNDGEHLLLIPSFFSWGPTLACPKCPYTERLEKVEVEEVEVEQQHQQ